MDRSGAIHPYVVFKDHSTDKNNNTEVVVLEAIRAAHPESHVTSVSGADCDILGWAAAGHAQATLLKKGNNFVSRRRYIAPKNRLESTRGRLDDVVTFGQYALTYQGRTTGLYMAEWAYDLIGRNRVKMYCILANDRDVDDAGHSLWADELMLLVGQWTAELHEEIYVFDNGQWEKDKNLYKVVKSIHWDDIILDQTMKLSLIDDVQGFFNSKNVYRRYAVPWKRGIIFHGPPGCGKTMSIKALMSSLAESSGQVATLLVKRLDSSCSDPQDGVRLIFEHAREMAPCLLVFEDLDSLATDEVRSYFLNEVDGLEDNNGILMLGSTNHLERLDPAITKRPSRFDRKYHFKLPGETERIMYCEYWKTKLESDPESSVEFDTAICEVVARMTDGFSFAYMKELLMQSLLTLARATELNDEAVKETIQNGVVPVAQSPVGYSVDNVKRRRIETLPDSTTSGVAGNAVPEHLLGNPLMAILRNQITALRQDMESVERELGDVSGEENQAE